VSNSDLIDVFNDCAAAVKRYPSMTSADSQRLNDEQLMQKRREPHRHVDRWGILLMFYSLSQSIRNRFFWFGMRALLAGPDVLSTQPESPPRTRRQDKDSKAKDAPDPARLFRP
jgi:hypothetical protein